LISSQSVRLVIHLRRRVLSLSKIASPFNSVARVCISIEQSERLTTTVNRVISTLLYCGTIREGRTVDGGFDESGITVVVLVELGTGLSQELEGKTLGGSGSGGGGGAGDGSGTTNRATTRYWCC